MTDGNDLIRRSDVLAAIPSGWLVDPHTVVKVKAAATLADERTLIEALKLPEIAALVEDTERLVSICEVAGLATGVCCCGDNIEGHSDPMSCGHSPVDMWDYHGNAIIETVRATLRKLEGGE